jgi:hypothetical protein
VKGPISVPVHGDGIAKLRSKASEHETAVYATPKHAGIVLSGRLRRQLRRRGHARHVDDDD